MTIRYEINPPKIDQNPNISIKEQIELLATLKKRVNDISQTCDGIHITDSVLGIKRISPLITASEIQNIEGKLELTFSLRVRDRTIEEIDSVIKESISNGLKGVLVLKGDAVPGATDSGLVPSQTVKFFNGLGFNDKTKFYLSLPSNPNFDKIRKKIDAEPTGFITQVISSVEQVTRIVDELKPQGFKIIPCILLPSIKNQKSAEFLKLNFEKYENNLIEFIKTIHKLTGDILLTSPNDFKLVQETLPKLV